MSAGISSTTFTTSPDETAALARRIAPLLVPGDVVLLSGEIGAGKTHFARALIDERLSVAGRAEDIPSPTFTIVQSYDDGLAELWHVDLYRLGDLSEIVELGLEDAFQTGICIIEWPDRLGPYRPDDALEIQLDAAGTPRVRNLSLVAASARWDKLHPLLAGLPEAPATQSHADV